MTLSTVLTIYAIGFATVIAAMWLALRKEPTAHGQIVGTQMGCLLALLWPLALVYGVIFGIGFAGVKAWQAITGGRA